MAVTNDAGHTNDDTLVSPRVARSREKVLRAATELLVQLGPRAVTVDAVSETSGVAKSTLYRHWSSRTELLIDVIRSNSHPLPAPDLERGFEVSLRSYMTATAVNFADPNWMRIFPSVASLRTAVPELDAFFVADIADKKRVMDEVLALGVAEGVLPASVDFDDAASMLIGPIVFAALTRPTATSHVDDFVSLAGRVVDRFLASYRSTEQ